jgi:hypothetical protein
MWMDDFGIFGVAVRISAVIIPVPFLMPSQDFPIRCSVVNLFPKRLHRLLVDTMHVAKLLPLS